MLLRVLYLLRVLLVYAYAEWLGKLNAGCRVIILAASVLQHVRVGLFVRENDVQAA